MLNNKHTEKVRSPHLNLSGRSFSRTCNVHAQFARCSSFVRFERTYSFDLITLSFGHKKSLKSPKNGQK